MASHDAPVFPSWVAVPAGFGSMEFVESVPNGARLTDSKNGADCYVRARSSLGLRTKRAFGVLAVMRPTSSAIP